MRYAMGSTEGLPLKKELVYEILGNIPVDWKEAFGNELCRTNQDDDRRPMRFSFSTSKGVAEIKISGNSEIRERKLLVNSDPKMVLGLQKVKQILAINSLVAENDNLLLNIYNNQSKLTASVDFKSLSTKFFPFSKIIWKQNEDGEAFIIFDSTLVKGHEFLSMVDSLEEFYNSLYFRRMEEPNGRTRCAFIERSRQKKDGYFEFRTSGKSNNPIYFLTNRIELDGKNCSDLDSLYGFYFSERIATFFQPISKGGSFEVRGLNGYKYNSSEIKAGVDRLEAKYLSTEVKHERMFQTFLRGSIDTVILTKERMDTIGYLAVQCATAKNVIEETRALSVLGWAKNPETPLQEKVFLSSDSAKTAHERFSKLCMDLGKGVFVVESSNENSNDYDTEINLNGDENSIISEFLFHTGRVFAKPNSVGYVLPNNLLWIGQYELNGSYFP